MKNDVKLESSELMTMTAQIAQQIHRHESTGTKKWDYKTAAFDLPVQVGSLLKLIMQLEGQRYAHGLSEDVIRIKIADELADILSLVLFIASEMKIDLSRAWQLMLQTDASKVAIRK